jgi:hypothetical protein
LRTVHVTHGVLLELGQRRGRTAGHPSSLDVS